MNLEVLETTIRFETWEFCLLFLFDFPFLVGWRHLHYRRDVVVAVLMDDRPVACRGIHLSASGVGAS